LFAERRAASVDNTENNFLSMMGLFRKVCHYGLTLSAVLILASPARANTNYVVNGGFETTTNGNGQLTFNTIATSWTNLGDGAGHDGYNFLFSPGTADTIGATGADGNLKLWGPNDGSANGLPATSPDGGNYIAADGVYEIGAIQQQISGLTIGTEYTLGFWWGGAQQSGFSGITTEGWDVSIGDIPKNTAILTDPNHGFTGWQYQSFTFIADSVSPLLSFLAVGTPAGEPPFSLLDGVNLQQSPEPGSFALIGLGLVAVPLVARLRRRRT
jgi:hypothetical protein